MDAHADGRRAGGREERGRGREREGKKPSKSAWEIESERETKRRESGADRRHHSTDDGDFCAVRRSCMHGKAEFRDVL